MLNRISKALTVFLIITIVITIFSNNFTGVVSFADADNSLDSFEVRAVPLPRAKVACLMDYESGRVLFSHNDTQQVPMASTTKILTAIVAIENGNLDDIVTVSKNAADTWGSDIKLKAGEQMTLRQLLYGLMLNSGNDAAVAIAEHVGGSVEGFAEMMNKKAAEIGAVNSHFVTPHGLDVSGHYTTGRDLAEITRYALHNKVFSQIVGTKTISIPGRTLHNTNELLGYLEGADGVKTGYTGLAGRCLVASATRNGRRYIAVALGCVTTQDRTQTCTELLNYAFDNYKTKELFPKGLPLAKIKVEKGKSDYVQVFTDKEGISVPVTDKEFDKVQVKMDYPAQLEAPVSNGMNVGTAYVMIDGNVIAKYRLHVDQGTGRKNFWDHVKALFDESARVLG